MGRSPGANGDAKACAGEKYSLSTPFRIATTRAAHSGAAAQKRSASSRVTKRVASARAAMSRSQASSRVASLRYRAETGHGRRRAYSPHFAESMSTKSTKHRTCGRSSAYCAIGEE